MSRLRAAVALALLPVMTGGCVVAAVPVAVGGLMARDQLGKGKRDDSKKAPTQAITPAAAQSPTASTEIEGRAVLQPQLKALPAPGGGGEGAASSLQAYQGLWTYLSAQAAKRKRGETVQPVVLAPGSALDAPRYEDCGAKPLAAVFDVDESPEKAADPDARWRRWKGDGSDMVVAAPGAVEGVEAARREGVVVIFTSARSPEGAPAAAGLFSQLGFGTLEPGKTLFLRGEASAGDTTRQTIAAGYCVIALVGDSLEDFSGLFGAAGDPGKRRTAATETMVAPLWGAGWFILPNAVHSIVQPQQPQPQ